MLASEGKTADDVRSYVEQAVTDGRISDIDAFSWHSCKVAEEGLVIEMTSDEAGT